MYQKSTPVILETHSKSVELEQQLHSISSMSTTIVIVLDEFSTKSHTSGGILPESEVPLRSKHSKEDINPISEGILPLKLFERKSIL